MNRYLLVLGLAAAGLLLGWNLPRLLSTPDSAVVAAPPSGGDFSLRSPTGPFHLADYRGKVVLIYFGYTFCPDICPTNLALISQALNGMTEEELAGVRGVFVSVDPDRDTLEKLASYSKYFHPAIVGVTGSAREVAAVATQYGAAYHRVDGESRGGYLVDHSSNTYVIAQDGSLDTILPHATPPQRILETIRGLLAPGRSTH